MTSIALIDPGDSVIFEIDWSDVLPDGDSLDTVTHTLPAGLTKVSESTDALNQRSLVRISGALHGQLYQIEGAAVLASSGETINRQFPLRCFNG